MGGNLFTILTSTIKSKFASIVAKVRLWTSWSFVKTRIIGGIRDFFVKLMDVRPKNKNDYYTIFGWMVSKKLAYAIIVFVGVISLWYISVTTQVFSKFAMNGGLRTYAYNNVLLRLAKNRVRIKGKSGYLAYEGEVDKGFVTGAGNLYSPSKVLLYSGAFLKNKYEGEGTQYYDDGTMHYTGTFHENLYEGTGKLYRQDGTEEYEGEFMQGLKEGQGVLYDQGNNKLYEGSFASDDIVYSELLGKGVDEIRAKYLGHQTLYESGDFGQGQMVVVLSDIDALYLSESDDSASDEGAKATAVYVLDDRFRSGSAVAKNVNELKSIFGEPFYEGNSNVILPEAVAINMLNSYKYVLNGSVTMDTDMVYSDDIVVNDFDRGYQVYIYSFKRGGLVYSFVGKDKDGYFEFYYITEGSEEEDAA
ncbi:MAG: hypothetical protein K5985_11015 [Lachnospiraceae bacterium]|nr:hypothetical protein [Lachnospiraceae bacterium]